MSASGAGKPIRPSTSSPAGEGSRNSARNTIALGCTGPPTYTGSLFPAACLSSCGTASPTVTVEGRLSTIPIAPASLWAPTSTTLRRKLVLISDGAASSSCPLSDSSIPSGYPCGQELDVKQSGQPDSGCPRWDKLRQGRSTLSGSVHALWSVATVTWGQRRPLKSSWTSCVYCSCRVLGAPPSPTPMASIQKTALTSHGLGVAAGRKARRFEERRVCRPAALDRGVQSRDRQHGRVDDFLPREALLEEAVRVPHQILGHAGGIMWRNGVPSREIQLGEHRLSRGEVGIRPGAESRPRKG